MPSSTNKNLALLPKGSRRLYILCLHLAIGASIWGYNIGILSSILVHPGWKATLHYPTPSQKGLVTGIYYLGTLLSYLFLSHPLADWLGRRHAALVGTLVLCVGAALMAGTRGGDGAVAMMAVGRWVCGVGVGVVSTTVPLYQSEISPAHERGKFVTMNHAGFITGLATGLWVGYAMTFWNGPTGEYWGWRVSILLQFAPAIAFAAGLPFISETPRWLVEKGEIDQARKVLHSLRDGVSSPEAIAHELRSITDDIDSRHRRQINDSDDGDITSKKRTSNFINVSLSLFRDPALFARLWRAFLLQFMAQMCGATAMKYYLPTLLKALGLGTRLALMAGAIEMTAKIGMTVVEMWVIDRFGRKVCLVGGSLVMGIGMLVNGALPMVYPGNTNKASDVVCIIFIFIYAMGYSLGLGPAAWVYSSEIFPTSVRARGLNFAASGGSIGSVIVAQVWPIGIAKIGSGIYFFFMAVNFACVPIIWLLYPETKRRALEDMDDLFGKTGHHSSAVSLNGVAEGEQTHGQHGTDDDDDEDDEDDEGVTGRRSEEEQAPLLR